MLKQIRKWLEPPVFPEDEGKNAQARIMNTLGLYFVALLAIAAIIYVPFLAERKVLAWGIIVGFLGLYLIARAFMVRGKMALAIIFIITSVWIVCEVLAFLGGGVTSPVMFVVAAMVIAVSLTTDPRLNKIFLALNIFIVMGLGILQQSNIPLPEFFARSPMGTALLFVLSLIFIHLTMNLAMRNLENALASARQQNEAREKAEATLRESEEKYRLLFDNAGDSIFVHDANGRILAVNSLAVEQLGYTREELLSMTMDQLDIPEKSQYAAERIELLTTRGYYTFEMARKRKDGSVIPIEVSAKRIIWDGTPAIMSICRDITERKQAEEKLRASEALNRAVISSSPIGVSVRSPTGQLLYANESWKKIWAIPEHEFALDLRRQRNALTFDIRDGYLQSYQDDIRRVYEEGGQLILPNLRTSSRRPGAAEWVSQYFYALYDEAGAVERVVILTEDITERKRAEDALRTSQEETQAILNAIPDLMFEVDREGRFYSHRAPSHVTLYVPPDVFTGRTVKEVLPEQAAGVIMEALAEADRQGWHRGATYSLDLPGGMKWFELSIQVKRGETRPARRFIALVRDISERKQTEEIIHARLRISEFAANHSLDELLQNALDELCGHTNSPIGFFHFVEPDQRTISLQAWSTRTLKEFCSAEGKGHSYDIYQAGVWVDCLREGKPVIHNDYASLPHRKGLPKGHAPVIREMVFPIVRDHKMLAIIGVGNKTVDYTESDVDYASNLADMIWDIAERKRAEEQLQKHEAQLTTVMENTSDTILWVDQDGLINFANQLLPGLSKEEVIGSSIYKWVPQDEYPILARVFEAVFYKGEREKYESQGPGPDGEARVYDVRVMPVSIDGKTDSAVFTARDITERKQAEETERELRTLAEALSSSIAALNSTLNFHEVLDRVLDNVGRVVPHDAANIMLLDLDGDTLAVACNSGYAVWGMKFDEKLHLSLTDMPLLAEAARSGQPLVVSDTRANPAWVIFPHTHWIHSYLTVPIQIRQRTVGFLNLDSATPNFFSSGHAERLQTFASQAAIAIENARLYEEVQKLAVTDGLTGIFNRTFFETEIARMDLGRDFPVSIIIADLDNMKTTNDRLGHPAGDRLLQSVARALQETFRASDIIARIGGDEFAILLPRTDLPTTEQMLVRIRSKLAEHNARHPELPMQLSLGASTAEQGRLMDAFILADQRMYAEKSAHKAGFHPFEQ